MKPGAARRFSSSAAFGLIIALMAPATAQNAAQPTERPISAIEWLSAPAAPPAPQRRPAPVSEPPVAESVLTPTITTAPLDGKTGRATGLFPPSRRGLPQRLWDGSNADKVIALLRETPQRPVPALGQLVQDLMLVRAAPPRAGGGTELLAARVDRLLVTGAAEDALSLLEASTDASPELFRRRFDAALLTGAEDYACAAMEAEPTLAPNWSARVFCLARGGDWPAAALTLGTARALGDLSEDEEALLTRFLDPDLFEGSPPLPMPEQISPLDFRMREAIGEPVPTATLPLAYTAADLRHNMGWKSRIEAGERLSRHGALAPETLLALYREGRPSASGGVWDRVAAIQALDTALTRSDTAAADAALPEAWAAMVEAQIEPAFATLWGTRLARMEFTGAQKDLACRLIILSPAAAVLPSKPKPGMAYAIATGMSPLPAPQNLREAALADGLTVAPPVPDMIALSEADRAGEALLMSVTLFERGRNGDPADLRDALATLRALGQEQTARHAALQILLLERGP